MKYKVQILETLRKVVEVDAKTPTDAIEKVREKWLEDEIGNGDFYDVEFETLNG